MDNLHVNGELATTVIQHEDTDTAAARLKRIVKARPQVGLVNDGEALLHVTSLSHGDNVAILHVENAVLLENGTKHCLHDDTWSRVRDKGGLLMQLPGEEVNSKVAVLPSRG